MTRLPPDFVEAYERADDDRNPVVRVLVEYGRTHAGYLALAVVSTVLASAFLVLPTYLLGLAIDAVLGSSQSYALPLVPDAWLPTDQAAQFVLTLGLLVATVILASAFHSLNFISWTYFEEHTKHELRTDLYARAQDLGLAFFESAQTGDVMSVLNDDVNQLDRLLNRWTKTVLRMVVRTTTMVALILYLNWQLGLLTLLIVVPTAVLSHRFGEWIEPRHDAVRSAVGRLNARLSDTVGGIQTVKAYTNEGYERDRVTEASRTHRDAAWSVSKLQAFVRPVSGFLNQSVSLLVFLVGGWWAIFGPPVSGLQPLSVGAFVTIFFYSRGVTGSVVGAVRLVGQYNDVKASAKRVYGLLETGHRVSDDPDATELNGVEGAVAYEGVSFAYPGTDEPTVSDVSFDVDPGEFVGLVGTTGAGKSTLCKLLLRFYDVDEGAIRVDDRDIRGVTQTSLRSAIGYVGQEPFLFDGTVRENVRYGAPDADDETVREAARRANAHAFVTELADGYETRIGERGVKLSGGQRQRLAIARAILVDPPILVLDEATSHVDTETERLIQAGLEDLVAERTTFAIAHRLSTVRDADRILVIEDGRLVESGGHRELLAREGRYADLWNVHVGEAPCVTELADGGGTDE